MGSNRVGLALVVGAVVLFATGWLIFNMAFAGFYAANAGSATGVDRETQIMWAHALASLAYAALILYAMRGHLGGMSIGQGTMTGAVVGCLMWFTVDFVFYAATNMSTLTLAVVDPILEFIHGGIGGAAIAAVLRSGSTGSSA